MQKQFTTHSGLRIQLPVLLAVILFNIQPVFANFSDSLQLQLNAKNISKVNKATADIIVRGKVLTAEGPLQGVSVKVKGSDKGVMTDASGNYSISATANATLVFSYTGYAPQQIAVNNRAVINVTLVVDTKQLEEVIVTGYRSQARGTITGAVSSVNSSEFSDMPVDNLSNALAGRLSGVTVTQSAGTPGMESSIKVRAMGTFNNADPLYVIDGVVSDKFAFDGMSPNEVESITILKDGASAAIYGSRAANGVILVTSKRGKLGTPKLSYSGIYGVQSPTKIPKTLNAFEHANAINIFLRYNAIPETDNRYYTQDELDYFKGHSWNWVDEMWKNPTTTQHSLDVSGGTQNVRYFLGGSYNYATGSFNNLDFQKFNLRGNVDVSVTKNLKVSLDLNADRRNTDGPSWQVGNWRQEDLYKALLYRTSMVPPFVNGLPTGNWVEWHPGVVIDPSLAGYNKREWTNYNATLTLNYKVPFIEGLSMKASLNGYKRDVYNKQLNLPYNMTLFNTLGGHNHIVGDSVVGLRPRAAVEFLLSQYDKTERYQLNAQINYKRSFGKHNIDALLVYEQAEENAIDFNGQRIDLISSSIDQIFAGSSAGATVNGGQDQSARVSYVGLASYNYDQKYLLEASFRYDGSVIFAPENRWGFFPSVSAGWRISEESFFKNNIGFINDLKFRGSVGLLGNDAVGNFQWLQSFQLVDSKNKPYYGAIFKDQTTGIQPGVLANRSITWEKALNYNAGFDSRFWDNKMNFNLDVFYRNTYDILGSRQLSIASTFGADMPDENYEKINTHGFEIELGYNNHLGSSQNPITYYVRGNFSYATNEIIQTDQGENIRPYQSVIGRPVGLQDNGNINGNGQYDKDMLWGYVANGILRTQADIDALPAGYTIIGLKPQLGMLNYKDIRGPNSDKPDGKITADDQQFLAKYSIPPTSFGLTLGASWKSLSLDVLFQGVAGGKVMLPTTGRDIQGRAEEASLSYWADSWTPENPDAKYPGYRSPGYRTRYPESSFWLVDNSFVRLKNLSVSYSLPKSFISRANLNSVRAFFTGSNLLMLYSGNDIYDPEMNSITAYPMMKAYSFGLNISL
jgi:TonB-linked SusC/RagA family outer membrane protein